MKLFATTVALLGLITATTPTIAVPPESLQEEVQPKWTAEGLTENEEITLNFLQQQGITDKWALAVVMGNIKQESKFHPNICEGGARVPYNQCYRGGYGLVQWTTSYRYWGLGKHAERIGGDPSTLETQLSYMVTEQEWLQAVKMFRTPNKSQSYYMQGADIWLGWGVYGNRGHYSTEYFSRLSPT